MRREMFDTSAALAALVLLMSSMVGIHAWYFAEPPVVAGWRTEVVGGPQSYDPGFTVVGGWYPEQQPSPWKPTEPFAEPLETKHFALLVERGEVNKSKLRVAPPTVWLPGVGKVTPNWYFLRRAGDAR